MQLFNLPICDASYTGALDPHGDPLGPSPLKQGPPMTGPWIWYWAVDHLVPGRGSFGTGPWIIWYRAVDHLVPGRGSFGTRTWIIWYQDVDHLVPGRGSFGTGTWIIWYRDVDHLVPGRGSFGTGSHRKKEKEIFFFFNSPHFIDSRSLQAFYFEK